MWSRCSECWLKCFTGGEQLITEPSKVELVSSSPPAPAQQGKSYVPLKSNSEDLEAESPGVDVTLDLDVNAVTKRLEAAVREALSIMSDESLSLCVDKDEVKVWGKVSARGYVLKTRWHTLAPKEEVIKFVRKFDIRTTWDGNVSESRVVATLPEEVKVVYQLYKKVLAVSPRDILLACKTYQLENAWLEVSASIESTAFPPKEQTIRAQVFTGGYQVRSADAGDTEVTAFSEMDFGGSIPNAAMMRMSALAMPAFVKSLNAALFRKTD